MRALGKSRDDRFQSAREMQAALEEFVRHKHIRVSTIALQHFMQELFAEKLTAQKEALLQGKQLADVIEARLPVVSEPRLEADASRSSQALAMTSTPRRADAHRSAPLEQAATARWRCGRGHRLDRRGHRNGRRASRAAGAARNAGRHDGDAGRSAEGHHRRHEHARGRRDFDQR